MKKNLSKTCVYLTGGSGGILVVKNYIAYLNCYENAEIMSKCFFWRTYPNFEFYFLSLLVKGGGGKIGHVSIKAQKKKGLTY